MNPARFLLLSPGALLCSACSPEASVAPPVAGESAKGEIFVDVAGPSGLEFRHVNGMTGKLYFCEMMGPGAALCDLDGDGDLDAYLVQGHHLGPESGSTPSGGGRIFENELAPSADGARRPHFRDVTAQRGLVADGYGMGVATGDVDDDGRIDLYLTNFGPNQLWLNRADGKLVDATPPADVGDERWSTSASFLDYDRDGRLDLYVANYVDYRLDDPRACRSTTGRHDYCSPANYPPSRSRLFHNAGAGALEDVSAAMGIDKPGPGLGTIAADYDEDGWIDVYVANDLQRNFLWINDSGKGFHDEALLFGCALDSEGRAEASMGVDAGDIDNDGHQDILTTTLTNETSTLYLGDGHGAFLDATNDLGLSLPSLPMTGFGAGFLDYDNDGWLDILAVNGAVTKIEEQERAGSDLPLCQPGQLFHNGRGKRFEDVSARSPALTLARVSRGAAFGDIDQDGDLDCLIADNNTPARLLVNQVGQDQPWIGLRLVERGRDALGARVSLVLADGTMREGRAYTDGSYLSARDPRVLFGLGDGRVPSAVRVRWVDGQEEEWSDLPTRAYSTLARGSGRALGQEPSGR